MATIYRQLRIAYQRDVILPATRVGGASSRKLLEAVTRRRCGREMGRAGRCRWHTRENMGER